MSVSSFRSIDQDGLPTLAIAQKIQSLDWAAFGSFRWLSCVVRPALPPVWSLSPPVDRIHAIDISKDFQGVKLWPTWRKW